MLRALGAKLLDSDGSPIGEGGGALSDLVHLELSLDPRVRSCNIIAAADVTNPLLGPSGAAAVFAPQKGADPQSVEVLEAGLTKFAVVVAAQAGVDLTGIAGGGAAGGLGAAICGVLGGTVQSGAALVFELIGLDEALDDCDLVLTGEGSFDEQSLDGKGPFAVVAAANACGIPAMVIAGRSTLEAPDSRIPGVVAVESLAAIYADPFSGTSEKVRTLAEAAIRAYKR